MHSKCNYEAKGDGSSCIQGNTKDNTIQDHLLEQESAQTFAVRNKITQLTGSHIGYLEAY